MKFDPVNSMLLTDDGRLIKRVYCPRNLVPEDLPASEVDDRSRTCSACQSRVVNLAGLTDDEALALVQLDPKVCVFAQAGTVKFVLPVPGAKHAGQTSEFGQNSVHYVADIMIEETEDSFSVKPTRSIRTARGVKAINAAVAKGFWPLLRVLKPAPHIHNHVLYQQNRESGEIREIHDLRGHDFDPNTQRETGWLLFSTVDTSPMVAAYLIPPDLQIGEKVRLADLIENVVAQDGPQFETQRWACANAIWRGNHFEIMLWPTLRVIG